MDRKKAWALALVATLTMTVSYIDRQTLAVMAPTVTSVFSLTSRDYGLLLSAFSMAYLVGTPAAGWLIDRVGARRGLPVSLLIWTLVAAAHALVPGFYALFALRILLGLAESPSFPGAAQTIQRALPERDRARGLGVLFTGSSVGAMIAPKLATTLNSSFGWQGAFVGSALVGLSWVPLWLWLTSSAEAKAALDRAPGGAGVEGPRPSPLRFLRELSVQRAMLVVLASAPGISFSLLWGSKYLVKDYGLTQAQVGDLLWIPPLFFDVGSIFFGDQASRRGLLRGTSGRWLMGASMVLLSLMALAPLGGSPLVSMLILGVSMLGGGGMYALATADMMARVPPSAVSTAGGVTASAQSLVHIVMNPLLGQYIDKGGGYGSALVALGLWALPGGVLWILLAPPPPGEEAG